MVDENVNDSEDEVFQENEVNNKSPSNLEESK